MSRERRRRLSAFLLLSLIATLTAAIGPVASPAAAAPVVVASDLGTTTNLNTFTNNAPPFSSAADGFDVYQRNVSPSIPFAVLDDSLSIFPGDTLGIVTEGNTDPFFGVTDTVNGDTSGPVSAVWEFDVSGATDLTLDIDMAAMGDFEASDVFTWTYSIDGSPPAVAFANTVDEAGAQSYTLEGGAVIALDDPMQMNGTNLTNDLVTFSVPLVGSGSTLTLTLEASTDGGSEAFAFQNIVISTDDGSGTGGDGGLIITGVVDGPLPGGLPKAIELLATDAIADLSTWGVGSANNGGGSDGVELSLSGSAAAGQYLYVATETVEFNNFFGFTPDFVSGSAASINGDDAVELFNDGVVVDTFGDIDVDGTGEPWEYLDGWACRLDGTGPDGATFVLADWAFSGTNALDGETDNATAATPFPLAGSGCTPPDPDPLCVDTGLTPTPIHAIQGSGDTSPLANTVQTVEGIVVGDFQEIDTSQNASNEPLGGFMIQSADADADGDPATSEGLFVFDPDGDPAVAVGDVVRVQGQVTEFFGLTEINGTTIEICSSGAALPTAATPTLPTSVGDPVVDWEAIEGMRVSFSQDLTVTGQFPLSAFGEVQLSAIGAQDHPNQVNPVGSAAAADFAQLNLDSRVILDDGEDENENFPSGLSSWNPNPTPYLVDTDLRNPAGDTGRTLRDGDVISGLTGVVHFSFGEYEVHPVNTADPLRPSEAVTISPLEDRPATPTVSGALQVAAFNVLNYFTTLDTGPDICGPSGTLGCRGADTQAEFDVQAAKIVAALTELDADVVGLIEIENAAGDGPVADLVGRLNASSARTYDYVATGAIGTDAIRVAVIYDVATVTPAGSFAVLDSSFSPAFIDTLNRPTLAASFTDVATGEAFTVAVNHLKSKGSPCDDTVNPGDAGLGITGYNGDPDTGVFAGNCNLTRTTAAQAMAAWLDTDPTGVGTDRTLIIGDLNAYANEDPILALEAAGYVDLVETFAGSNAWADDAHSYVFDGEHGTLDYVLASAGILDEVTDAEAWHINADEPFAIDYQNFNPLQNAQLDQYKSSDHDPVIVGLDLAAPGPTCNGLPATIVGTGSGDVLFGTSGPDVIVGLGGGDLIYGRGGADVICAGGGADLVFGGSGADQISGERGGDLLFGQRGRDHLDGGGGFDSLFGGSGADTCTAGEITISCTVV